MTAAVGMSTSLHQAMIACALNGVGLALVIPSVQSVVADSCPPEKRGRAFGAMSLTSSVGALLGAFFATNAGARTFYGVEGWRASFFAVAAVSLLAALLVLRWAVDPRSRVTRSLDSPSDSSQSISTLDDDLSDGGIRADRTGETVRLSKLGGGSHEDVTENSNEKK